MSVQGKRFDRTKAGTKDVGSFFAPKRQKQGSDLVSFVSGSDDNALVPLAAMAAAANNQEELKARDNTIPPNSAATSSQEQDSILEKRTKDLREFEREAMIENKRVLFGKVDVTESQTSKKQKVETKTKTFVSKIGIKGKSDANSVTLSTAESGTNKTFGGEMGKPGTEFEMNGVKFTVLDKK